MNHSPQKIPPANNVCPDPELLVLSVIQSQAVSGEAAQRLVDHLFVCPKCSEAYDVLCDDAEECDVDRSEIYGAQVDNGSFMTNQAALDDLWSRIDARDVCDKHVSYRRNIYRIGRIAAAIAACLLLVVGAFWRNRVVTSQADLTRVASGQKSLYENKVAYSKENPLSEVPLLFIPEPISFNPAGADYTTVVGEKTGSLCAAHPWIVAAQKALRAQGIDADCLDILVISGSFRQFCFDSKRPFREQLMAYEPTAMRRLAEYYQVPEDSLAFDGHASSALTSTATGQALGQWRSAVLATVESGSQIDLYRHTVHAGPYLAQNYGIAALWVYRHPQEAQKLLNNVNYRRDCQIPLDVHDAQEWGGYLTDQSAAAKQCIHAVNELLRMPAWDRCAVGTSTSLRQLRESIDKLAPVKTEFGNP